MEKQVRKLHFDFKKFLSISLAVMMVAMIFGAVVTRAQVNVATSFVVLYDGEEQRYSPGEQVILYAPAIVDGQYFSSFAYDPSVVRYPGVFYNSTKGFILTFTMPSCDVEIGAVYDSGWAVTNNGARDYSVDPSVYSSTSYTYVDNDTLTVDQSGRNISIAPGQKTVQTFDSSDTITVTIDGNASTYAKGQPIIINTPYIYDEAAGIIVDGYTVNGSDVTGNYFLYTDLNTGLLYRQTTFDGRTSDTSITTHIGAGTRVIVQDNAGNTFANALYETDTTVKTAIPTMQGEYEINGVTAVDENNNPVTANVSHQTDGITIVSVPATSEVTTVTVKWHEIKETTSEVAATTKEVPLRGYSTQLNPKINSTGLLTVYSTSTAPVPEAQIDADDIQRNRDEIIALQKMLSDGDGSGSHATYFFHNPTITYADGSTQTLEGWFMQQGSDIPDPTNPTWLQVG